jgi:exopolyphosphatase / guanosine-5'-triphosphate,3'-diphosphate pyrophosphatase
VRLGVLDVGSNTVHLLVVDAHRGAAPIPFHKQKHELRLAEHLLDDGRIDEVAVNQLITYVQDCVQVAEDLGCTNIITSATSAIREAPNGDDVLTAVHASADVRLVVVSGEEEARLTFLAARRWLGWSAGHLFLFDIGGGSLEMAVGRDEVPDAAISLPLGSARMYRRLAAQDPPAPQDVKALRKHARQEVAGIAQKLTRHGQPERAVATSKTFKQLARICGAPSTSLGAHVERRLALKDLREWVPRLAEMTVEERATLPGTSEGRAAQMVAGAIVAEAAMEVLGIEEVQICPWALREGVILRFIDSLDSLED